MAKLLQVTPEIAANEILLKEHWKEIKGCFRCDSTGCSFALHCASSKKRLK
jgi:hypothetical protein